VRIVSHGTHAYKSRFTQEPTYRTELAQTVFVPAPPTPGDTPEPIPECGEDTNSPRLILQLKTSSLVESSPSVDEQCVVSILVVWVIESSDDGALEAPHHSWNPANESGPRFTSHRIPTQPPLPFPLIDDHAVTLTPSFPPLPLILLTSPVSIPASSRLFFPNRGLIVPAATGLVPTNQRGRVIMTQPMGR
jgi:hypothetical protein